MDNGDIEDAEEKGYSLEVKKKIPCVPNEAFTFSGWCCCRNLNVSRWFASFNVIVVDYSFDLKVNNCDSKEESTKLWLLNKRCTDPKYFHALLKEKKYFICCKSTSCMIENKHRIKINIFSIYGVHLCSVDRVWLFSIIISSLLLSAPKVLLDYLHPMGNIQPIHLSIRHIALNELNRPNIDLSRPSMI